MFKWFVKKINNRKGFTLVELVVVIAILGILSAIAVPKFSSSRFNAAVTAHNTNVRTLESAANMAVVDGTTKVEWQDNEGKETNGKAKGWENYIQEWPKVPSGLEGQTTIISEADESVPPKYTPKQGTIPADAKYRVEINESGGVTVTPGKITN